MQKLTQLINQIIVVIMLASWNIIYILYLKQILKQMYI